MSCERCGQEHTRCAAHVIKHPETREPITARPCMAYPRRGATVCQKHGGDARQVRVAAVRRAALAEEMARNPRRTPGAVMVDALHGADVLAQRALEGGDPEDALEAIVRAASLAKGVIDAGVLDEIDLPGAHMVSLDAVFDVLSWLARGLGVGYYPNVIRAIEYAVAALRTGSELRPVDLDKAELMRPSTFPGWWGQNRETETIEDRLSQVDANLGGLIETLLVRLGHDVTDDRVLAIILHTWRELELFGDLVDEVVVLDVELRRRRAGRSHLVIEAGGGS